jgi:hypothetical protein
VRPNRRSIQSDFVTGPSRSFRHALIAVGDVTQMDSASRKDANSVNANGGLYARAALHAFNGKSRFAVVESTS